MLHLLHVTFLDELGVAALDLLMRQRCHPGDPVQGGAVIW